MDGRHADQDEISGCGRGTREMCAFSVVYEEQEEH